MTNKLAPGNPQILFNLNHLKAAGPLQILTAGVSQPGSWIELAGEISPINIVLPFPVLVNIISAALPAELTERIQNGFRDHVIMEPQQVAAAKGNARPMPAD